MTTISPTKIMVRDELIGFARSKVMLVLWVLLPGIAIAGFLLIDNSTKMKTLVGQDDMTATDYIGFMLTSLAASVAALMVAVDIVSERQRKVYELFVIRPMRRETILWAKFIAVTATVSIACLLALGLGLALDQVQGDDLKGGAGKLAESVINLIVVIALSASVGIFVGSVSRTILIAVLVVLYGAGYLIYVPMLPKYLGVLPDHFWLLMAVTCAITAGLMAASIALFRKSEF